MIDVPAVSNGSHVEILMNADIEKAVAILKEPAVGTGEDGI